MKTTLASNVSFGCFVSLPTMPEVIPETSRSALLPLIISSQFLFDPIKRLVANLVVRPHGENGFSRGTERFSLNAVVLGVLGVGTVGDRLVFHFRSNLISGDHSERNPRC